MSRGIAGDLARRVRRACDRRRCPRSSRSDLLLFVIFCGLDRERRSFCTFGCTGPDPPDDAIAFLRDVLTTGRGWSLTVVGGLIGFIFAALALCISVVSFPLMLDRDTLGLFQPLTRRFDFRANIRSPIALWGLIVAATARSSGRCRCLSAWRSLCRLLATRRGVSTVERSSVVGVAEIAPRNLGLACDLSRRADTAVRIMGIPRKQASGARAPLGTTFGPCRNRTGSRYRDQSIGVDRTRRALPAEVVILE